ncbi:MAG TPA: VOC family protein [Candidatus Acidoferrum sp.]|jgi:uncharacterized glyoxalase superfamily protein PhnB
MLKNRSVPTDTILPHVMYRDVGAALTWLTQTFGFVEHYRYGQPINGAQLHLGSAWIMIAQAREGEAGAGSTWSPPRRTSPAHCGCATQSLTVFIEDIEKHYENVKTAARIVEDLHETAYGELQYAALDLEGHHWLFSRHAKDVSPEDWGATIPMR